MGNGGSGGGGGEAITASKPPRRSKRISRRRESGKAENLLRRRIEEIYPPASSARKASREGGLGEKRVRPGKDPVHQRKKRKTPARKRKSTTLKILELKDVTSKVARKARQKERRNLSAKKYRVGDRVFVDYGGDYGQCAGRVAAINEGIVTVQLDEYREPDYVPYDDENMCLIPTNQLYVVPHTSQRTRRGRLEHWLPDESIRFLYNTDNDRPNYYKWIVSALSQLSDEEKTLLNEAFYSFLGDTMRAMKTIKGHDKLIAQLFRYMKELGLGPVLDKYFWNNKKECIHTYNKSFPLLFAVRFNLKETFDVLVHDAGVRIDAKGETTPLRLAIRLNNEAFVHALLDLRTSKGKQGYDVNAQIRGERSVLGLALNTLNPGLARRLHDEGALVWDQDFQILDGYNGRQRFQSRINWTLCKMGFSSESVSRNVGRNSRLKKRSPRKSEHADRWVCWSPAVHFTFPDSFRRVASTLKMWRRKGNPSFLTIPGLLEKILSFADRKWFLLPAENGKPKNLL